MEECLERFVVIFASERVGVSFCGKRKVFKEGYDGGIVIVEQTRRWHTEKRDGQILGWLVLCPRFPWFSLDLGTGHILAVVLVL